MSKQRIVTVYQPTSITECEGIFSDVPKLHGEVKGKIVQDDEVVKQISSVFIPGMKPTIAITLLIEKI